MVQIVEPISLAAWLTPEITPKCQKPARKQGQRSCRSTRDIGAMLSAT